ncbi:MAG: T9SS type A sorting domain-containing protein [Rubricoccaceae bacterium]|nr:T9SS type A sorting domain-containing protein [Rubricoccaceae bacterium]
MYRLLPLLFAVAVATAAQGQPGLSVTPDTLFVHETFVDPFAITNIGTEPVTLDSVFFGVDAEPDSIGVAFDIYAGDDYYVCEGVLGRPKYHWCDPDWTIDGLALEPDSTAELYIWAIGYCVLCREVIADTPVRFFWSGEDDPIVRTLVYDRYLSSTQEVTGAEVSLRGPYPNPTRSETVIEFNLIHPSSVQLWVYSVIGRTVYHRDLGRRPAGRHSVPIHLQDVAPGIYFIRIASGDARQQDSFVRRLVILP